MKSGAKPELSSKWWLSNKAKTLPGKELTTALKAYEDGKKKKDVKGTLASLRKLPDALAKTIKSCNKTLHKDTLAALEKFPAVIANETERIKKLDVKADHLKNLDYNQVLLRDDLRKTFVKYYPIYKIDIEMYLHFKSKKNKGDQSTYDLYIKTGEMNIGGKMRKMLDAVAKEPKPDWSKVDWDWIAGQALTGISDPTLLRDFLVALADDLIKKEL